MRLDQENYNKATALEIAGGGKLYHVVVNDEAAGSRILKEGQLKQRVTVIPLNKITAREISQQASHLLSSNFWR
jgi:structural maintenance of chromosome 2